MNKIFDRNRRYCAKLNKDDQVSHTPLNFIKKCTIRTILNINYIFTILLLGPRSNM